MKITIYELLGLVKDDNAPKKIKSKGQYYNYDKIVKDYYEDTIIYKKYLFKNITIDRLNDEVEIIEEKKIPEKLEILNANDHSKEVYYENYSKEEISLDIETLQNWVNKIIDYLKSKGDE